MHDFSGLHRGYVTPGHEIRTVSDGKINLVYVRNNEKPNIMQEMRIIVKGAWQNFGDYYAN